MEFFWGRKHPLSQWHPAPFTVDNIRYATAEHYMMAKKALLFDDLHTWTMIILSTDPKEAKKLGRKVKNFNQEVWNDKKIQIVFQGNMEKFKQNVEMRKYLLSTKGKKLVEASQSDKIWGIGLSAFNPEARDIEKWKGSNLMGKVMELVRETLNEKHN